MAESIRVRIPPSPTGYLHVGTARTALFNELFAKQQGGVFIVRIEDTDEARSRPEFETNILEGLAWLGITWEEGPDVGGPYGPYRQSERIDKYQVLLQNLLDQKKAYLDGEAIKLKVEPQAVTFTDLVRGEVTTHSDSWGGDFVIARSLKAPLYHFVVVADDAAMKITHVIRGEDHISNTARQILLQRALGLPQPLYAHLPLLLDEQRRKLSKRKNETSLLVYRDLGYLPEAMVNYLALLGWNPKTSQEFFTHDELRQAFDLSGVQKSGAVFSIAKLQAMNKHYLRQLAPADLLAKARPYLAKEGIAVDDEAYWQAALTTEQERVATLQELAEAVHFFRKDWKGEYPAERLVWKKSSAGDTQARLAKTLAFLEQLDESSFAKEALEEKMLAWIDGEQLGRGDTLWPLRVALTGREHSPGPFEVAAVLGKPQTLARLQAALAILTL